MRRLRIRTALIIVLAVMTAGMDRGTPADPRFVWEPFHVSRELLPDLPNGEAGRRPLFEERLPLGLVFGDDALDSLSAADGYQSRSDLRVGYFRLFLSRSPAGNGKFKELERHGDRLTLDMMKSLPGALRTDPSRAVDSFGAIFQPQLNLGIEF